MTDHVKKIVTEGYDKVATCSCGWRGRPVSFATTLLHETLNRDFWGHVNAVFEKQSVKEKAP